jgi:tetratricopeptide (TPR) repeat protein
MSCLSDATLAELVEGRLPPEARAQLDEHLDRCPSCRNLVVEMVRDGAAASGGALDEPAILGSTSLPKGSVVGRYVVLDVIGIGGMGVVYGAYDPKLERRVALKVLRAELASRSAVRARLSREAQALAKLSHPNVISVHDVGVFRDDDGDGEVFVAMELVTGGTLGAWLRAEARSQKEIVARFVLAGRGLAAAHAAGLVHRDFKPENVLLGADGRVRVTDFGLARSFEEDGEGAPSEVRAERDPLVTRTGAQLGTPAYMAPEQHAGAKVDARADQFAFAVALFEALAGERPYPGKTQDAIARSMKTGITPTRAWTSAPITVRRAVERALSIDPAARFPTMAALIAELERGPSRRARAVASAVGATLLIALGLGLTRSAPPPQRVCESGPDRLQGAWDAPRRAAVERAFGAVGKPFAIETAKHVADQIDAYADAWGRARTEACEATRVRGEQSERVLDLRMACFDRRRIALGAAVDVLARADRATVLRAAAVVEGLPPIESCSSSALVGPSEPPRDAASQATLGEMEAKLAEAEAQRSSGHYPASLEAAHKGAELARSLGHRPTLCVALSELGFIEDANEQPEAGATFEEAYLACDEGQLDRYRALVAAGLFFHYGYKHPDLQAAARYRVAAETAVRRIGGDDLIEGDLWNTSGAMALQASHLDEAIADLERALRLLERSMGPTAGKVSVTLDALAMANAEAGHFSRALALWKRAIGIAELRYGPDHPEVARILQNVSGTLLEAGHAEEALADMRRVLAIREGSLDPDNPQIAYTRYNVGELLRELGRFEEAAAETDTALAMTLRARAALPEQLREIRTMHGRALVDAGNVDEGLRLLRAGVAEADAAKDDLQSSLFRFHLAEVLEQTGKHDDASAMFERVALMEAQLRGEDHPNVGEALAGQGRCELGRKHTREAIALLEKALVLSSAEEVDPKRVARIRFSLAGARLDSKDHAAALADARRARQAFADANGRADLLAAMDAFLATKR